MRDFNVAYIPIGVPTFHMESANEQFTKSVEMLKGLTDKGVYPEKPLLSIHEVKAFVEDLRPDLVILQNTTFANSAYASEVVRHINCPIILWTLREPVNDGGRLRLNSLTGAYSAGNLFRHIGIDNFEYVYGGPTEDGVISKINATIKAAKLKKDLRNLNMASIGQTPQGFGFGRALDAEVFRKFGINLTAIEVRELMIKANNYKTDEYAQLLDETKDRMVGLDNIPQRNVDSFVRLYKAYKDFVETNNIKAIASRCWPDYFVEFGTPVCGVLSMLNDTLVAASCESDLMGALSMYIGMEFSGSPTFFGDPVSLDETKNTVTFWHCGMASCSLARKDTGAEVGVHPNRKIGPTMEFGCKAEPNVTIFRIGRKANGDFRFFIAKGEALDEPKQFMGTSVVVKTHNDCKKLVETSVKDGWEPHFVIVYGNVIGELEVLANFLDIEVCSY